MLKNILAVGYLLIRAQRTQKNQIPYFRVKLTMTIFNAEIHVLNYHICTVDRLIRELFFSSRVKMFHLDFKSKLVGYSL